MSRKTTTSALVVLGEHELTYSQDQLPKVQAAALEQIERVHSLQREAGARAIMAGLALHRVKASSKHGTFLPWIKSNVKGAGYTQASYYMRLAAIFVEKARVTKPDLLMLPGDQTSLQIDGVEGNARDFFEKLKSFVGDRSLNELLDKYDIKGSKPRGGAQEPKEEPEEKAPIDPEMLAAAKREELAQWLAEGKRLLIDENACQHLQNEDIRAFHGSLQEFTSSWTKHFQGLVSAKA